LADLDFSEITIRHPECQDPSRPVSGQRISKDFAEIVVGNRYALSSPGSRMELDTSAVATENRDTGCCDTG
jgi:hypothetical protein